MKRVYIAGRYSAPTICEIFANMRRGLRCAAQVVEAGFSAYVPWMDVMLHMHMDVSLETCYGYSMEWLKVSEAVIVVPEGAEQSKGTQAELSVARDMGIPIFHRPRFEDALADLREHFKDSL